MPTSMGWMGLEGVAAILASCAVEVRYPGRNADREDAHEALQSAKAIRNAARTLLGLAP